MKTFKNFIYEKESLEECVILASELNGAYVIGKTRDRNYVPNVNIVRELKNGMEIVYLEDLDTGWMEGMNGAGIGIVNTALMVDADEKEKSVTSSSGKKSMDGPRIIKALEFDNINDTIQSLVTYEDGIKGHTFVSDGVEIYTIEATNMHEPVVTKRNINKTLVRTNHGYDYKNSGYIEGDKYVSSLVRRASVLDNVTDLDGDGDVDFFDVMHSQKIRKNSFNNPLRRNPRMFSTSQYYYDLTNKTFNYKPIKAKVKFKGIIDKTPKAYKPLIKINIEEEIE